MSTPNRPRTPPHKRRNSSPNSWMKFRRRRILKESLESSEKPSGGGGRSPPPRGATRRVVNLSPMPRERRQTVEVEERRVQNYMRRDRHEREEQESLRHATEAWAEKEVRRSSKAVDDARSALARSPEGRKLQPRGPPVEVTLAPRRQNRRQNEFHYAVDQGDLDIVQTLLAQSSDSSDGVGVNQRYWSDYCESRAVADCEQTTALHVATLAGHTDLVSALLRAGADPSALDGRDESPVDIAHRLRRSSTLSPHR